MKYVHGMFDISTGCSIYSRDVRYIHGMFDISTGCSIYPRDVRYIHGMFDISTGVFSFNTKWSALNHKNYLRPGTLVRILRTGSALRERRGNILLYLLRQCARNFSKFINSSSKLFAVSPLLTFSTSCFIVSKIFTLDGRLLGMTVVRSKH